MTDLRTAIREKKDSTEASIRETDQAWLGYVVADDPFQRKMALKMSFYRQGFADGLQWVLDQMDSTPAPHVGRPALAADRIATHLAEHPEDGALSVRKLADRVGVSASAVNDFRTKRGVQK